jgi:hypothetical protein
LSQPGNLLLLLRKMARSENAWAATCPRCQERQPARTEKHRQRCVCCGALLGVNILRSTKRKKSTTDRISSRSDPIVVRGEDFRRFVLPIIEMHNKAKEEGKTEFNGFSWLARELGKDPGAYTNRIKSVLFNTRWVSFSVADRWLTAMGIYSALGTDLKLYANPRMSRQTFESWFLRCGDEVPDDLEFVE